MKIFDCLTHPTIDSTWLNPRFSKYASLEYLLVEMAKNNIYKAFAVGLKGVGAYDEERFINFLQPHTNLIPIAFCNKPTQLDSIKALGYKGIKIHPRLSKFNGDEDVIFDIIKKANELKLIVLYCGFLGLNKSFVDKIKDAKIIYLHCGAKDFLNTFNALRHKKHILFDLSYTMCIYQELHEVIYDTLCLYPHRFCIGSDHPEVDYQTLRNTFEKITMGFKQEDKELIAFKNLERFLQE